jgi:hypothetical protein
VRTVAHCSETGIAQTDGYYPTVMRQEELRPMDSRPLFAKGITQSEDSSPLL